MKWAVCINNEWHEEYLTVGKLYEVELHYMDGIKDDRHERYNLIHNNAKVYTYRMKLIPDKIVKSKLFNLCTNIS